MVLLLLVLMGALSSAEYVDPFDMNSPLDSIDSYIDPSTMQKANLGKVLKKQRDSKETAQNYNHLKRTISLLLHNSHLDFDNFQYVGHINLNIEEDDYDFLKKFAEGDDEFTQCDLTTLEVISRLEKSVRKTKLDKFASGIFSWKSWLFEMVFNYETGVLSLLVVILYVMYRLTQAKFTALQIVKYLFLMSYLIDWFLTYMHLRDEQIISDMTKMKQLGPTPPECQPDKMAWTAWFGHVLRFSTHCKDYHVLLFRNTNYFITPMKVFVKQFENLSEILTHVGQAFGKLGNSMFRELPPVVGFVLFPLMLGTFSIITIILLVFITKTPIEISSIFFKIKFGEKSRPQINYLQSSPLSLNHRPLMREIEADRGKKTNKKDKPAVKSNENASNKDKTKTKSDTSEEVEADDSVVETIGEVERNEDDYLEQLTN